MLTPIKIAVIVAVTKYDGFDIAKFAIIVIKIKVLGFMPIIEACNLGQVVLISVMMIILYILLPKWL